MNLRTKYIVFVVLLHLTGLVLSYLIFEKDKIYFIASEVVIFISVFFSWQLYNELLGPLNLLMQGTEAIRDRDFNVKFVATGKYEMDQLIAVYNQMIDELRLERTKQEQQHLFLEKLIHTSPTGIIILDFDEKIQQVNPRALQLLGLSEPDLLKRNISEIANPIIKQIQQIDSGASKSFTIDGTATYKIQKSHFIDRGFPRYFVMIEELTAEILAAEKKAYGKVIRIMAHEVNNSIGAVNSIIQSALSSPFVWENTRSEPLRKALEVASERNNNLNIFMRNFADLVRLPPPEKKKIDLNTIIRRVTALMKIIANEKQIDFVMPEKEEPFYVIADEQQMEQVLINAVKNAMEAISGKGVIRFLLDKSAGTLSIIDNGKGISPDIASHLFSPFYSTKKDGQGIGLTLNKEILVNHGFTFSLKSTADGTTEFLIRF
jgi:two-component system nitrogen regulation sensor histidine kinase NtrY